MHHQAGRITHRRSLADGRELLLWLLAGAHWLEAAAWQGLGFAYFDLAHEYAEGERCWQTSLALQREQADLLGAIETLADLSICARYQGRLSESLTLSRECYELACRIGTPVQRAFTSGNLGVAYHWVGQYDAAILLLEAALRLETDMGNQSGLTNVLMRLGYALTGAGHYEEAAARFSAGLALSRMVGMRSDEGFILLGRCILALAEQDYHQARQYCLVALPLVQTLGDPFMVSWALAVGALIERQTGDSLGARRLCLAALHEAVRHQDWNGLINTLWCLALLLADSGAGVRAYEVAALAERVRPSGPYWHRAAPWCEFEALPTTLPPQVAAAARERALQGDLWVTARVLLAELETGNWGAARTAG